MVFLNIEKGTGCWESTDIKLVQSWISCSMVQCNTLLQTVKQSNTLLQKVKQCNTLLQTVKQSNTLLQKVKQCNTLLQTVKQSNTLLQKVKQCNTLLQMVKQCFTLLQMVKQLQRHDMAQTLNWWKDSPYLTRYSEVCFFF